MLNERIPTVGDIYSFDYSSYSSVVPVFLKSKVKGDLEDTINGIEECDKKDLPNLEYVISEIVDFEMFGETEFAEIQTQKMLKKMNGVDLSLVPDCKKDKIAIAILCNENVQSCCLEKLKNSELFTVAVNNLKQFTRKFGKNFTLRKLEPFKEKSAEVARVVDFLNNEEILDYSKMKTEPVLTPKIMQEMARRDEVQNCIPVVEEVFEKLDGRHEEKEM